MKSRKLSQSDINKLLNQNGLILQVGSFNFCIRSSFSLLANSLSILYADYEILNADDNIFVDFHVSVDWADNINGLLRRNVQFFIDGFPPFSPLPYNHASAMFEWGMNWCVSSQINTHLIVHAAVIEKFGRAAILPAPPGSGKSTLTAALIQEGWRLLSDELTLICVDSRNVTPFPRPVSLKNESIEIISNRYPSVVFGPLTSDTLKGTICHIKPPHDSVQRQRDECPVGWVVFPKYEQDGNAEFQKLNKCQALLNVANNSFNYSRLGVVGFDVLRDVIDKADCFEFSYSDLDDAIAFFDTLDFRA